MHIDVDMFYVRDFRGGDQVVAGLDEDERAGSAFPDRADGWRANHS